MSVTAIVLVVLSAGTHAGWNLLGKRSGVGITSFLYASVAGAVLLLPGFLAMSGRLPAVPASVWPTVAATGLCQALYYTGLAVAYQSGALSFVYPLARAIPVLAVALISAALGRTLSTVAVAGCGLVFVGCLWRAVSEMRRTGRSITTGRAVAMSILAAAGTTGYTLLDDHGLATLRATGHFGAVGAPLLYGFLELAGTSVFLMVICLVAERRLRDPRPVASLGMGVAITVTYLLVLVSMAFVSNVSYVAAFRQLSIPLGVLLAVVVLKERIGWPVVAAIGVIVSGLVLLAVG